MDGASNALAGFGYVVLVTLAAVGGCTVVTSVWYGVRTAAREWQEWQREKDDVRRVEDLMRKAGDGR
jgi:hypothetical protein